MKKIGILFGQENTFPAAFVDRINEKKPKGILAEPVKIDKVMQAQPLDYAVIIDRISQDVPFYRGMLKNAAICGTAVINNPFWWSADEKFFNNCLAVKLGIPVPNTVLLPSNKMPDDTSANSFRNLSYPLDWEKIFKYVGFPAYMKPFAGGGWKSVYRLEDVGDFFAKHSETEQLVMMLQEEILFDDYYRCYCIGGKYVRLMQYEPRNPHHLRYVANRPTASKALLDKIEKWVLALNHGLGYDFNTVEFAVRDGIPYAIDFCNPAPDAELTSVGQENFDWVVETSATYAIERAQAHKEGLDNLTWGTFMRNAINRVPFDAPVSKEKSAPKAKKVSIVKVASPPDDLKIIEGIGPKAAKLLNDAGIMTFADLAGKKVNEITTILEKGGSSFKLLDPETWAAQAKMAAAGKMDELKQWQSVLNGGKGKITKAAKPKSTDKKK